MSFFLFIFFSENIDVIHYVISYKNLITFKRELGNHSHPYSLYCINRIDLLLLEVSSLTLGLFSSLTDLLLFFNLS